MPGAARIIIRFYYRLTIGRRRGALDRKVPWQTARTKSKRWYRGSPDRRSAEEKGIEIALEITLQPAAVTVAVNSAVTSTTDFIIDVARVTYKNQFAEKSTSRGSFDVCVCVNSYYLHLFSTCCDAYLQKLFLARYMITDNAIH